MLEGLRSKTGCSVSTILKMRAHHQHLVSKPWNNLYKPLKSLAACYGIALRRVGSSLLGDKLWNNGLYGLKRM